MTRSASDQQYLQGLTVLYVEDDDETREEFAVFLRRQVGALVLAANGEQGLRAFRSHNPAIVLTDVQMPVMDGLAMVEEIRRADRSVQIIIMTAFEQTGYLWRAINAGVNRYLLKPVNGFLLRDSLLECAHRLVLEKTWREQQQLADRAMSLLKGLGEQVLRRCFTGATVLLVAQAEINRMIIHDLLADAGLNVLVADTCAKALEQPHDHACSLILIDLPLLTPEGLVDVRRLRNLPGGSGLPLLAMVEYAGDDQRALCADSGIDDLILKPVDPDELYCQMVRHLTRPSA